MVTTCCNIVLGHLYHWLNNKWHSTEFYKCDGKVQRLEHIIVSSHFYMSQWTDKGICQNCKETVLPYRASALDFYQIHFDSTCN